MLERLGLCLALLLLLCACAPRPGAELFLPVRPDAAARSVRLFVATDRRPDAAHPGNFTSGRSSRLHFLRYVISVPPDHKAMQIEWSGKTPVDPAKNFAMLSFRDFGDGFFPAADNATTGASAAGNATTGASAADNATIREPAVVFVHGYNTNYAESVLRAAQLLADNPQPGRAILFAWPSDGSLTDYVADKDAATVSRDHLARFLVELARDPHTGGITLIGHSMGCWLTMEALRQLRLTGQDAALARLSTVLLAAPDIDLDVFRAQLAAVGRLQQPITVLTSPDDRALAVSSRLGGDRFRVGELDVRDPRIQALAKAEGIQLIDISAMAATDSLNHDKFIGAAATLRAALGPRKRENPLRRAGAFLLDAVASVLEVPGRIGRAAADGVR